jgi:hypothetical protein
MTLDVLLVYRVDRFSRNLADTVALLEQLDHAGVAFRSSTEPFDTSGPMGRMLLQLLAMFANSSATPSNASSPAWNAKLSKANGKADGGPSATKSTNPPTPWSPTRAKP